MMKKTIVVFANSVKHGQHCVAGKELSSKSWIRPVSTVEGGELTDLQCAYKNPYGEFLVKPLQKVELSLNRHVPMLHQPENYLVSNEKWNQKFKIEPHEIYGFLDAPESLWGIGNRVDYSKIQNNTTTIQQSLYLIQAEEIRLYLDDEKRRIAFLYKSNAYDLPVTDPNFHRILIEESAHNNILCVSLGGEYNGYCYKLVATIL